MKGFGLIPGHSPLMAAAVRCYKTPKEPRSASLTHVQVLPEVVSIPNLCVCACTFFFFKRGPLTTSVAERYLPCCLFKNIWLNC